MMRVAMETIKALMPAPHDPGHVRPCSFDDRVIDLWIR